jgi:hypothetical protein
VNRLAEFPEICLKHFTSRFVCPWNPQTHDYLPQYMRVLEFRNIRRILEIGLGPKGLFHPDQLHACGLRMWAETFPDAKIFGLDNDPKTLLQADRITSYLCDQSKEGQLQAAAYLIGGDLDLIVDDGSHIAADQIRTARIFVPMLSADGVYVIEDVHEERTAELARGLTAAGIRFDMVACSRAKLLGDDRLCIIEKRYQ